jgi:hypothetical protein
MTTIRQVCERSLRLIEENGAGMSMTAQQGADALEALISMLDSWSIQNNLVFTETRESFTLTANDGEYTIGTGGDFNTSRPVRISSAFVRTEGGTDYSLDIIGADEYALIADKDATGIPSTMYYDGNYPLGKVLLWPVPSAAYALHLTEEKPLSNFSDLDDVLSMPPGYERGIVYNLAIEIAPEYGKEPKGSVIKIAGESKKAIESANSLNNNETLEIDSGLMTTSSYNVYTGQ